MELTNEQRKGNVHKAIALLKQSNDILSEAYRLVEEAGFQACDLRGIGYFTQKPELHIYSGIYKIAELFGVEAVPQTKLDGTPYYGAVRVEIDGTELFEVGDSKTGLFK